MLYKLAVVNVTGSNNYEVLTIVVCCVIVSENLSGNVSNLISISLDWLSHHMLSERVEVRVLHGDLLIVVETGFVLVSNLNLELFDLSWVQLHVADGITKEVKCSTIVFLEALKLEAGVLSV